MAQVQVEEGNDERIVTPGKTVGTPVLGADLGATKPHDPGLSRTHVNGRIVRDLHGKPV
jgi:hypothetical protein